MCTGELCGLYECMKGRCGLHVVAMVAMGCVWTTYGLCVCYEGGMSCMWWPWGECGLPMGCVCAVREVRAACGGHRVCVDYLWAMCVL